MNSLAGRESWQREEEQVYEEMSKIEYDEEIARMLLPIGRSLVIAGIFVRILLFLVSFKWPRICKTYLVCEIVLNMCDQLIVNDSAIES